jgi:hypothetical protein
MITVYAWYPFQGWQFVVPIGVGREDGTPTAGHASMAFEGGYVSWTGGGRFHAPGVVTTYDDDVAEYGSEPHEVVSISGLDEVAIGKWWQEVREKQANYLLVGFNCAKVVAYALKAGGADAHDGIWHNWNLLWLPIDAIRYARSVASSLR